MKWNAVNIGDFEGKKIFFPQKRPKHPFQDMPCYPSIISFDLRRDAMGKPISKEMILSGRKFSIRELEEIQETVSSLPNLSRRVMTLTRSPQRCLI